MDEQRYVLAGLKALFPSASDLYVDINHKECEIKVSVDEFQGEIRESLIGNYIRFTMVDYCDTYPYKYVFAYQFTKALSGE